MEDKQNLTTVITVDDARKILGEKGKKMTDKEIGSVINTLIVVCDKTINHIVNTDNI